MSEFTPHAVLATALRERRAIIADRSLYERAPDAHLAELKRVSEKILLLQGTLPQPVPAQLAHFLDRCSYDKALAFLEEMSPPASQA